MYKILNDYSAPNLKQLFNKRNEAQTSYNLQNNQTDITLPNTKTEYLKRTDITLPNTKTEYLKRTLEYNGAVME